ncbi:Putative NADPH-quinone reductase (modulator of drug activity B) [Paenibacillus algorifonticola]|uniref:Putative NADPH-quinone reductase (Modulator of drug activity B) n=1 Tax=Paenibacillus algorifonticola TaxID=684063 RepID=A0A1I2AJR6_9BACL|nr:NAD(P)H-dependent oxidoreductase [Paenibacillus algorifonticola]SFE44019.1 Putative NADPH-quinone reductase (modulator of drug activity B) [Paenibacillus algorifonticola]
MKTLVIVTHPDLLSSRINKAWINELRKHDNITIHSLYEEYPAEEIDTAREQSLLKAHDRIIFQYPLYWYSSPPLLKKWFDAVLQHGWAYGEGGDNMQGKEIGVAISTGGSLQSYEPEGANRFTIRELMRPVEALAHFIGASYLPPFTLGDIFHVTEEQLEQSKMAYVNHITTVAAVAK